MTTKQCCHNEGKLILSAFFARLPDVSMVLFCLYLLWGDTAAPCELYARLCHAFLVFRCSGALAYTTLGTVNCYQFFLYIMAYTALYYHTGMMSEKHDTSLAILSMHLYQDFFGEMLIADTIYRTDTWTDITLVA